MSLRKSIAIAAVTASALLATYVSAIGQERLRVATFGGAWADVIQKYTVERFTRQTGIPVDLIAGQPSDFLAQMIASRGRQAPFDLAILDDSTREEAARLGVIEKNDPAQMPNLKHLYPEAIDPNGYGPAMVFLTTCFAYNKQKYAEAGLPEPTSWNDLWDPKLAGHVTVPSLNVISGRSLLLMVSKMNGDVNNFDAAIDRISELKLQSVYESASSIITQLTSGDSWAAPVTNGRVWAAIDAGAPLGCVEPKEGAIGSIDTVEIVAGSEKSKEAYIFANMLLDPIAQIGMANDLFYGPTNQLLEPVMKAYPELSQKFPANAEEMKAIFLPDYSEYNSRRREVLDRWNRSVLN